MRHRNKVNQLGRTSAHRKAMMSNMASSLIIHKRIKTTLAKAKALRSYVEPLITRSKEDTTHSRREVFSCLQDKNAVTELFRVVSQKVGDRPGGYTRILKLENRLGDNAQMCYIELVDFNELYTKDVVEKKGARRTRRGGKKGEVAAVAGKVTTKKAVEAEPEIEDTITEEAVVAEPEVEDIVAEEPVEALTEETPEEIAEAVAEEPVESETEENIEDVAPEESPEEEASSEEEEKKE